VIRNAEALATTPLRAAILDAIIAGIEAARPDRALGDVLSVKNDHLDVGDQTHDLEAFEDVVVLGGGNVAGAVVETLESSFRHRQRTPPIEGLVVSDSGGSGQWIDVAPGDHPLPTERNVEATRSILERADAATADTLVLCVIGGGGSALLAAPAESIPLADYREIIERLLASGADIGAINTVRKHCSAIKGGQLAERLAPAPVVGLVFSDVVGDDLGTIASGPLWPDETTYADALGVLETNGIEVPQTVREHLEAGARGERSETPSGVDQSFEHVDTHLIANADTAVDAARAAVAEKGFDAHVLSTTVTGAADEAGRRFGALGRSIRVAPESAGTVCLAAGETTVHVDGTGSGGPSQAFSLGAAIDLAATQPDREVVVASVDTDGIDGASDAAGAIVDAATVEDPDRACRALADNDAGGYLAERDACIETGPTGTNVNDLYLVGVAPAPSASSAAGASST
jgi:hydroxypyruvate reductase